MIHEANDVQECQEQIPRVGYDPTYRGENEVYLCRRLRIPATRPRPGSSLALKHTPQKRPQLRRGPQLRDRKRSYTDAFRNFGTLAERLGC